MIRFSLERRAPQPDRIFGAVLTRVHRTKQIWRIEVRGLQLARLLEERLGLGVAFQIEIKQTEIENGRKELRICRYGLAPKPIRILEPPLSGGLLSAFRQGARIGG